MHFRRVFIGVFHNGGEDFKQGVQNEVILIPFSGHFKKIRMGELILMHNICDGILAVFIPFSSHMGVLMWSLPATL